jgi:hypothetical protein
MFFSSSSHLGCLLAIAHQPPALCLSPLKPMTRSLATSSAYSPLSPIFSTHQ